MVGPFCDSAAGSVSTTGSPASAIAAAGRAISPAAAPAMSSLRIVVSSWSRRRRRVRCGSRRADQAFGGSPLSWYVPRPPRRARPYPAIENVSRTPVTTTVTSDPLTNRIPEARRDARPPPAVERQRHPGQVGLGVPGAIGHGDRPALGDRAVDRQTADEVHRAVAGRLELRRRHPLVDAARGGPSPRRATGMTSESATAAARTRRITPPPTCFRGREAPRCLKDGPSLECGSCGGPGKGFASLCSGSVSAGGGCIGPLTARA